jgi:chromosome segregation ATPase
MTEEEIQALQDAKQEAEQRALEAEDKARQATADAQKAKNDLDGVVNELTEERRKKQEALDKANINKDEPKDVNSLIQAELERRENERRKAELEATINEFKNSKTEFTSDTSGLVFEKFRSELSRFNFSGVSSKEEAKKRLEEAYRFLNYKSNDDATEEYPGTPRSPSSIPDAQERTPQDVQNAIDMAGVPKEKYTELKSKYPEAFSGLGIE